MTLDVIVAGGIFLVAYALIALERWDRTLVALLGGFAVVVLGLVDQHQAFEAIDLNVIFLLAGMMILAGILRRTGFFQWVAIRSVKIADGDPFRLLLVLSTVAAVLSAFLDNVTTVVLIAPVTLYIATVLRSPRYRLYDESRNGGLWIGKNYAQAGLWRRDPLHNLSHGATTMQVARFYYLLETGNLVSPEHSRRMKNILSQSEINHKFFRGIKEVYPYAAVYRKSGTWQHWHADSAIVEHDGRRYIAVALAESPQGGEWLQRMIVAMDRLIFEAPAQQAVARINARRN